jgi:hypothetical protein
LTPWCEPRDGTAQNPSWSLAMVLKHTLNQ